METGELRRSILEADSREQALRKEQAKIIRRQKITRRGIGNERI
jgi:hypothetical protein